MSTTIQKLPGSPYLSSAIEYDQSASNLVIDVPGDLVIDKALSIAGSLLIRANTIDSHPGLALSAKKVTLVADRINFLGPIEALEFDLFSGRSYVKGPMPGGRHSRLEYYSAKPDFWSSLVSSHLGHHDLPLVLQ